MKIWFLHVFVYTLIQLSQLLYGVQARTLWRRNKLMRYILKQPMLRCIGCALKRTHVLFISYTWFKLTIRRLYTWKSPQDTFDRPVRNQIDFITKNNKSSTRSNWVVKLMVEQNNIVRLFNSFYEPRNIPEEWSETMPMLFSRKFTVILFDLLAHILINLIFGVKPV